VTGVGAVTPLGVGSRTLHERWSAGECGLEDGLGKCADFDPADSMSRKEARRTDRFTQFALAAADEATAEAGWDGGSPYEPSRTSCVFGTGMGGVLTFENQHDVLRERGRDRMSPLAIPLTMSNAAPATLAIRYGIGGESYAIVSACASGTQAIGAGLRMIARGDCDAVLVGGSEACISPVGTAAFGRMGALSTCGISRPFDRRRDGFVLAEGGGALVLEEEEGAKRRGAPVLGRVLGYGASSDAHHLTVPDAEAAGAARAIRLALDDAGAEPDDVDYVNAHGTSTSLNDRVETAALKAALGERAHDIPVSSTKSAIGHLLGGAGAAEAVATLLALRDHVAPPTLGLEEPEDGLDLNYVAGHAQALPNGDSPLVALSNSFGFGGHNAVVVLGTP
jgi:3-oxoacyl-[acyl-carrier-protein] synthase II